MERDEDDELAHELADHLDTVDAWVRRLLTPQELEIRLAVIKGLIALEQYLEQ